MLLLSPSQLRAARALLNWSRADLSGYAGVSEHTIHRFENEITFPEERTITKIHDVLVRAGIELIGNNGVVLQKDVVRTITGDLVFVRVLEDIITSLQGTKKSEALFACVRDKVSPPPVVEMYNRLRKQGIRMRSLVHEKDSYLMGNLNEYRCLPNQFFHNNTIVIYDNKVATMILDPLTGADASAVIVKNQHVAAAQRNLFELIWSISKPPALSVADKKYDDVRQN
ncbi:MAG: helix-turn-helix transcriptional regulator [Alphaproteobacteria bacterium]|nr:helix-turn-helix transcriptional regulator [Alphaproteobacteria bacterium]